MSKQQIGIFGGSFNPPHLGHVMILTWVLSTHKLDKILVIPCNSHPLGKSLAPFHHRAEMCQLAFGDLFGEKVEVSWVEYNLEEPNYTYKTLEHLIEEYYPEHFDIRLILGSDEYESFNSWKEVERIEKISPWPIVVPRNKGIIPGISSTQIRKALEEYYQPLALLDLVPLKVIDYIKDEKSKIARFFVPGKTEEDEYEPLYMP